MSQLSEKGWNKLSNQEEVKEVEVRALFNLIDKDNSGELSLEVWNGVFIISSCVVYCYIIGSKEGLQVDPGQVQHFGGGIKNINLYNICLIIKNKVEDWMAQVDANNDGKLSYDEFKKSLDEKITVTE